MSRWRRLVPWLRIAGVGLLLYWGLLFAVQRTLLFPRPLGGRWPAPPPDARILMLPSRAGAVEAWYLPPTGGPGGPAPVVVYHHGNGEVIDVWSRAFGPLRARGVGVLLVEYPGYGRSAGSPSEASLAAASCAAYDTLIQDPGVDPARVVSWGRSLGGGAAAGLARRRPVAALILESTFTSVRDLTDRYFAPGFLVRDPFNTLDVVRRFPGPVLVLHGSRDAVVATKQGRRLAAASPRSTFHERPCGHDDCPELWDLALEFLAAHGLVTSGADSTG